MSDTFPNKNTYTPIRSYDPREYIANCKACGVSRPVNLDLLCSECEREHRTPTTGVKHDTAKPRHSLLPHSIDDIIAVLEYGAAKYGERNWELGMEWSRPWNAAMRHLWAWWRGEECDKESGLPHLAHCACNILFLLSYQKNGVGRDDRR